MTAPLTQEQIDEQVDEFIRRATGYPATLAFPVDDDERAIYRAAYAHGRQDGMREAAKIAKETIEDAFPVAAHVVIQRAAGDKP